MSARLAGLCSTLVLGADDRSDASGRSEVALGFSEARWGAVVSVAGWDVWLRSDARVERLVL